ncbi:hypothetical protein Mth01_58200 [Sphaerimonospora thailandensis]|uniref:Uncharacterized protein n=1 Tax=Sphaerimonospora thailandensis TaxID=795644 RepID=A0A8J3RD69_9ACTN|nr:hypothetical protein Mth01_58200 [Sphaerimonospora thailandensis]
MIQRRMEAALMGAGVRTDPVLEQDGHRRGELMLVDVVGDDERNGAGLVADAVDDRGEHVREFG